jgi:methylamine--corrinoid protein Co-methyltransferase
MACEVGCGAAESGIKRREANDLVKKIVARYEKQIAEAPLGKRFQECYDVKKMAPAKDYIELYGTIKRELTDLGVPFVH